ncbi:MAG: CSLREA domain-containing protein, partial [Armatimonadota bacterium]|nr:CSLREA domain-containing protein [Armatimonadota bacterium]
MNRRTPLCRTRPGAPHPARANHRARFVLLPALLLTVAMCCGPQAHAAYTMTFRQVGSNVVGTGSGTINTSALTLSFGYSQTAAVWPNAAIAAVGPSGTAGTATFAWSGIAGPTSFGPAGETLADSGSGDIVGVEGWRPNLNLPRTYVSGASLSGTATWTNRTFSSLGMTPGSYTWTWGAGPSADSFTLRILPTIVVTTTADEDNGTTDPAQGTGTSLREAINAANNDGTLTEITFNIPGDGVKTITLSSGLTITQPVTIDGYSQPGASANTLASGSDAVLLIEINGNGANGLTITGSNCTIKGLAIGNCYAGIYLTGAGSTGNLISGNTVGLHADGATAFNNDYGIIFQDGANNNTVGGSSAAARNVLSNNNNSGVYFNAAPGAGNTISGNYIGTDAAGTAARGNGYYGVYLEGADNSTIGGTASGAGNLISGNTHGININSGATGNLVQGNKIGTNAAGTAALGNQYGVVMDGAPNNTIGGTA